MDEVDKYYGLLRNEIDDLLPYVDGGRILEIGCGQGATLRWVKEKKGYTYAVGVELDMRAAEVAMEGLDRVYVGNIEEMSIDERVESFDVILCLDVLEHLREPEKVVKYLEKYLVPGGLLIASIPNVRNFRVTLPLVFFGRWRYEDSGLLDRTHLRFFTESSAKELLSLNSLCVEEVAYTGFEVGSKARILNIFTLGLLAAFLKYQFLISSRKVVK